jgi:hypothetical protein
LNRRGLAIEAAENVKLPIFAPITQTIESFVRKISAILIKS